jgi:hypothetical protein
LVLALDEIIAANDKPAVRTPRQALQSGADIGLRMHGQRRHVDTQ